MPPKSCKFVFLIEHESGMDIQSIKQRFEIIGNSPGLHRAIEVAVQVAPTDLSVLISGRAEPVKRCFPRSFISFRVASMVNILQ